MTEPRLTAAQRRVILLLADGARIVYQYWDGRFKYKSRAIQYRVLDPLRTGGLVTSRTDGQTTFLVLTPTGLELARKLKKEDGDGK